jgi:hypothetical protein
MNDISQIKVKSDYQNLFETENLVLWARSEMIGSAIDQVCSWFQVSVKTEPWH